MFVLCGWLGADVVWLSVSVGGGWIGWHGGGGGRHPPIPPTPTKNSNTHHTQTNPQAKQSSTSSMGARGGSGKPRPAPLNPPRSVPQAVYAKSEL